MKTESESKAEEGEMGREGEREKPLRIFRVTGERDGTPAGIEEVPVPKADVKLPVKMIPLPRTDETARVIRELTWEGLQR